MNYRKYFQFTIIKLQQMIDQAAEENDWEAYDKLRHRIILIKNHITSHELKCGYDCECDPDPNWSQFADK